MSVERIDHDRASALLPDLMAGALDEGVAASVEEHREGCRDCREWAATYRLLEQVLGDGASPDEEEHPPADLLALCAVRPGEVFEAERADLREHLARCRECREELEILEEAIQEARPEAVSSMVPQPVARRSAAAVVWGSLAAGLAALGIGTALFLLAAPERLPSVGVPGDGAASPAAIAGTRVKPGEELSDVELDGQRVIVADSSLLVRNVKVKPGGRITFRVGEVAAFGDGFQISDGGALVVESGTEGDRKRRRSKTLR